MTLPTRSHLNVAPEAPTEPALPATVIEEISRQLQGLRFGSVEIIVHDGTVTQIERREKVRLAPPGSRG